ncbi:MAG: DNA polymerase III subunit gamma/tau, partial [Acidobacteria bacterium]
MVRNEPMQRPSNLRSFLGNPRAVDTLVRAIERNRLPHAMIFAGPAGVGKRTLAHLLAQLLNCLAPSETDACATCMSCHKVLSGVHP